MIYFFGITGPIGHGKSLFAEVLAAGFQAAGFETLIDHFAKPFKRIAKEQFGWDGKKDDAGRHLLQMIGTDAGRHYNPDIWVLEWATKHAGRHEGTVIITDDVRFENEASIIRNFGGRIIHIRRGDHHPTKTTGHESEDGIARMPGDLFQTFPFPGREFMVLKTQQFVAACGRGYYDA